MNLKELSNLLGLSQTTVSRALNGYPEVSEATRTRVSQAAAANNYRPNTRARGLAIGRSMAIGHIMSQSNTTEMINPIFGDFMAGASEIYSKNNYDMILSTITHQDELDAFRQMASKANVDGMLIQGPKADDPRIPLMRDLGLPFVVHGRITTEMDSYSWVDVNNKRAFERATDLLLQLGHRRIVLLNGLEDMSFAIRRRQGYEAAFENRGLTTSPMLMFNNAMTENYGYDAASALLTEHNAPTAFMTASLISAMGVRRAIEDKGLKLGQDVSLITYDDDISYLPNGADMPMFTATKSSVRDAGRIAAQMLLDSIENPNKPPQSHLLEAQLVIGQSTGPAPN